ncbi:cystathionine gamma-synthase [soil metagenome]
MTDGMRFETAAIHAGQDPDPATGAVVVPIYQTSTFVQQAVGEHKGFEYARTDNPTRRALETCLAALEGSSHAVAFGSGMAAITTLVMAVEGERRRVLIPDDGYGGTFRLMDKVLVHLGVDYATVDMTDMGAVSSALEHGAALLLAETPTNPLLKILDLRALSDLARAAGALFAVDNTFATPYVQRPLEHGADAVVYSATKYLGGHSDLVAGAVTTSDDGLAERLRFLQNSVGAIPGPFDSWLLLRGLKTLALRMRRHCDNAAKLASWLDDRADVVWVAYPGLPGWPGYELARRQMSAAGPSLFGGMITFELDAASRALEVCGATRIFFLGESLGGVESLIEHPGRMTHASLEGSGIEVSDKLVRLSVGIEHPDDLIADLAQALA